MSKDYKNKALSIKILDGNTEKEVKTDSQKITVGRDIENTLSLANPAIPNTLLLFEKKGDSFHLLISDKIKGASVKIDNSTLSICDLIKHGLLPRRDDKTYSYKIGPECSGTVYLSDVEFSFSLCDLPPLPPKPTIPKEFRRKWFNKDDLGFINILILSLAVHLTAAVLFETIKVPDEDITSIKKVPKRFAKLILGVTAKELKEITKTREEKKKKEKEKKEKEEPKEEKKEEPKEEKKEEKKEGQEPKEVEKKDVPVKTEAQRIAEEQTKRREKLKTKGVLAMLVGKKAGGRGEKTVSHFIGNKDLSQNIDKVLTSLGGLYNIKPTLQKKKTDDKTADIDNLIAKVTEEEKAKVKELKLKERKRANIEKLFDMAGSGSQNPKRSKEVIAGVVQTYIGGLKYLYDRELRKDPTLEGKVVVQFTILANGKVTSCIIVNSTMDNKRFEQSVLKRVRRWRFEPIEEGEVVITYPFVFFPVITG